MLCHGHAFRITELFSGGPPVSGEFTTQKDGNAELLCYFVVGIYKTLISCLIVCDLRRLNANVAKYDAGSGTRGDGPDRGTRGDGPRDGPRGDGPRDGPRGDGPRDGPMGDGPPCGPPEGPCFEQLPPAVRDLAGGLLWTVGKFIHENFEQIDSGADVRGISDFTPLTERMTMFVALVVHAHFEWIESHLEDVETVEASL